MNFAKHIDNGFALRPFGLGDDGRVCDDSGHRAGAQRELPALQD